jgi:hypothetical protein
MRYDQYAYLWPPRPEKPIPPDLMGFYAKRGWLGQVKKNGTCTVIFSHGADVIFKTRHDDDHKAWVPVQAHHDLFSGREQWNVYVAELLHSKVAGIRNHLYLFDVLVSDGEDLSGMSFLDRQFILQERWPGDGRTPRTRSVAGVGAIHLSERLSRAVGFTSNFGQVWNDLAPEDEGIVFKDPRATLLSCVTPTANAAWQVKCRRPNGKYSF